MRIFSNQDVRDTVQKEDGCVVTRVVARIETRYVVPLGGYNMLGELTKEPVMFYEVAEFDVTCESVLKLESIDKHLLVDGDDLVVKTTTIRRGS